MMDQPIKKSMNKLEAARRMVQWAIELSQFDIEYHPKKSIMAQALVDFITEFTLPDEDGLIDETEWWTIQTNDSSTQKKGGVGVIIITLKGEYEGVLTRLRVGKALGAKNLLLQSDSKLVIRQIKEEYEAKEERM